LGSEADFRRKKVAIGGIRQAETRPKDAVAMATASGSTRRSGICAMAMKSPSNLPERSAID